MTSRKPAGASGPSDRTLAPAAALPDGTPHPDPVLAVKGWQVKDGIYQRIQPVQGAQS
jgi:hypothetical protein